MEMTNLLDSSWSGALQACNLLKTEENGSVIFRRYSLITSLFSSLTIVIAMVTIGAGLYLAFHHMTLIAIAIFCMLIFEAFIFYFYLRKHLWSNWKRGEAVVSFFESEVVFHGLNLCLQKCNIRAIDILHSDFDINGERVSHLRKGETVRIRYFENSSVVSYYPINYISYDLRKYFEKWSEIKVDTVYMDKLPIPLNPSLNSVPVTPNNSSEADKPQNQPNK